MLTQQSQVCKCLLNSKTEVYILYKRVWSDQETRWRNERGGATSSEAAPEYFGTKWHFSFCYRERSVDPKISCVIVGSFIQNFVEVILLNYYFWGRPFYQSDYLFH